MGIPRLNRKWRVVCPFNKYLLLWNQNICNCRRNGRRQWSRLIINNVPVLSNKYHSRVSKKIFIQWKSNCTLCTQVIWMKIISFVLFFSSYHQISIPNFIISQFSTPIFIVIVIRVEKKSFNDDYLCHKREILLEEIKKCMNR